MAATAKHARIDSGVSSPAPANSNKFISTPSGSARKNSQSDAKQQTATMLKADNEPKSPMGEMLKRRRSTFKGITSSLMSMRRMTKGSMDKDMALAAAAAAAAAAAKPKVRMENTYKTSPDDTEQFRAHRAHALIQEVLNAQLKDHIYNPIRAPTLAAVITERIKTAVKGLHCERHKIVAHVVLGPVSDQGMQVVSRCLWDPATDTSSTVSYNNGNIFAIATVFAVYYE